MNTIVKKIAAEKIGTVSISMYKEKSTGLPIFCLQSENEDVLQLSYIIEDLLHSF